MNKIMKMMLVLGIVGVGLMKAGFTTWGLCLFTLAYYLFTLWTVLVIRKFLHFLQSEE